MMHPGLAVQSALHKHLVANETLTAILEGAYLYDDVPRNAEPPYVTFAEASCFDWSTGTEQGCEHLLVLNAWSKYRGRKQVLEIASAIEGSLSRVPNFIEDHALINLTHESTEVSKDVPSGLFLARITLRAITEPIPQ